MLIELTSVFTGKVFAIDHELIGEVKDQAPIGEARTTFIVHKTNRRVHWTVVERYEDVMRQVRHAEEAARGPHRRGPHGASDGQVQMAAVPEHGHGADLAGPGAVLEALA